MVVEHTFVTTMDAPDAMGKAAAMLQSFGFAASAQRSFDIGGEWNTLEVHRGAAKYRRSQGVRNWPQQVRLEWDRGRVDVAVSIAPPPRGRLDTNSTKLGKKETVVVQQLLMSIARSLEMLLAAQAPPEQACVSLAQLERQLELDAQRAKRRSRLLLVVVLVFFAVCIAALVVAIVNSTPGHHR